MSMLCSARCCKYEQAKKRKVLMRRIERELDISRYVRQQIMFAGIFRALMSKKSRLLSKRNYAFFEPAKDECSSTSSSGSEPEYRSPSRKQHDLEHNLREQMVKHRAQLRPSL